MNKFSIITTVFNGEKTIGRTINSASNFEISIGETALLIAEVMNASIELISDQERVRPINSEVTRLFGSNSKIKNLTNWEPHYCGLEGFRKGLGETIEWFLDDKNLSLYKNNYVL